MSGINFTAHRHPVMAVACPVGGCGAGIGHWCKRPSGHKAMGFHRERNQAADRAWLEAGAPFIDHTASGFSIREPRNDQERALHQNEIIEATRADR